MPSKKNVKPKAAKQLARIRKTQETTVVAEHLQPKRFSPEGFEWHRSSLLTSGMLTVHSKTVDWYLKSQRKYFDVVKEEVLKMHKEEISTSKKSEISIYYNHDIKSQNVAKVDTDEGNVSTPGNMEQEVRACSSTVAEVAAVKKTVEYED